MIKNRYRHILWFFARIIASYIWWDLLLARLGLRRYSRRTMPARLRKTAAAFRVEAIRMGGVMIKIGQFLSARLDVLPHEITDELAGLQDEVRPETLEDIRGVIETELNAPLEEKFSDFEPQPVASASIGQVYRAKICPPHSPTGAPDGGPSGTPAGGLSGAPEGGPTGAPEGWPTGAPDGEPEGDTPPCLPVMVKVQRPHIDQIVEIDLAALRVVGGWLQRYPPIRKRANIPRLLEEFATTLYEEIDYLNEGKNAETFATNFTQRSNIRIPGVYWSHTTRRVLTLVNVEGIKITNYAAIEEAGIDRVEVARRLFATYLQQIFEDRFFHADPHPGNLFVQPLNSKSQDGHTEFQIVFVDFGMVGKVGPTVFTGLRELLIAIGTRDAVRMVSSFKILDVLLPSANIELLQKATARAFERFWGKSTAQMMDMHKDEAAQFVQEFGELMYEMPFQFPENFILLGRCLGILSGICTGLDPDFNMWSNISPYASKLVTAEGGSRQWLNEIGRFLQILVSLPGRTDAMLTRLEQGNLEVRAPGLQDQIHHLEHATHRLAAAIILAAFLLSAVQLSLGSQTIPAIICGMAAVIALGWLLIKR